MTSLSLVALLTLVFFFAPLPGVKSALKPTDGMSKCVVSDPKSLHIFKPGCKEALVRAGRKYQVEYNSNGLRDREYTQNPKKGWQRIFMGGSSLFAGPGLDEKVTPPRKYEALLRKNSYKVEVINGGVEGYGALHSAVRMKEWLDAYSPTHLFYMINFSSSANVDIMNSILMRWEGETPLGMTNVMPMLQKYPLLRRIFPTRNFQDFSRVYTLNLVGYRVVHFWRCYLRHLNEVETAKCLFAPTLKALSYMKVLADERGIKFLFLVNKDSANSFLRAHPLINRRMADKIERLVPRVTISARAIQAALDELGISYAAMDRVQGPGVTLDDDYHWSEKGAEIFARQAFEATREIFGPVPEKKKKRGGT